ncbi:MAG: hypothetical protein RLZZ338_1485 [Cyanobacteriota bacterium]|jgi:hypothetical protein
MGNGEWVTGKMKNRLSAYPETGFLHQKASFSSREARNPVS